MSVKTLAPKAALAALAFAALWPQVAQAQYYEDDDYGGPVYERRYYRPAPRYEYRYETPRYYSRRAYYGNWCVTSRGTCETGQPRPVGSQCRCHIPGFGKKRGAVQG